MPMGLREASRRTYTSPEVICEQLGLVEGVLDYVFIKLGVDGANGSIGRPVVMTEPVANLGYTRKSMSQLLKSCRLSLT